jgi:hypothetical protein
MSWKCRGYIVADFRHLVGVIYGGFVAVLMHCPGNVLRCRCSVLAVFEVLFLRRCV